MNNIPAYVKKLQDAGFVVTKYREGDEIEDGMIELTPKIHIQMPTVYGSPGVVVAKDDGKLEFYPPRRLFSGIIADLDKAMNE